MGSGTRFPGRNRGRLATQALVSCFTLGVLLGLAPCAQAETTFRLDTQASLARFVHVRGSHTLELGRFERAHGLIRYDERGPAGMVDLVFQADSANTGSGLLNRLLTGPYFLHAHRYPDVAFQSQSVRFDQGRPVAIEGRLTIRDVTRTVLLTVRSFALERDVEAGQAVLNSLSTTHIHRSEFGLGGYLPLIGDEIQLEVRIRGIHP